MEPLLRGHPDERPPPLERPLDNVNLNINVLISTPDERPPLLKGHFSDAKGAASQEGFHCICTCIWHVHELICKEPIRFIILYIVYIDMFVMILRYNFIKGEHVINELSKENI